MKQDQWLDWAIELQSLAQAGLTYGRDVYDLERYQRLRDIAAEMLASQTDLPLEQVKTLFCNETGYQTPKVDTRAAVFRKGRILLVRENDGAWSFPGGWCEVNLSIGENAEKETLEEAGLRVQDRNRHNTPRYAYGIVKVFVLCELLDGDFVQNSETTESGFFALDALPAPLAQEKNSSEQIALCFQAAAAERWETVFD